MTSRGTRWHRTRCVAVDELARAQHGLITTEQAVKALGPSRKDRWVAEGRLDLGAAGGVPAWPAHRRPGTRALMAAALAVDGVVSHRSAAELWGLIQPAGYVEVSIAGPMQPDGPAARDRPPDQGPAPGLAVEREGLRITDPVRTVIDLGLVMPWWLVHRAHRRGHLDQGASTLGEVRALRDALGRPGATAPGSSARSSRATLLVLEQGGERAGEAVHRLARALRPAALMLQHEVWDDGPVRRPGRRGLSRS